MTRGRRAEFKRFARFRDEDARDAIPDPNAPETFAASRLAWDEIDATTHAAWLAFHRACLAARHRLLVPRMAGMRGHAGRFRSDPDGMLHVAWQLPSGEAWWIEANLAAAPRAVGGVHGTLAFVANAAEGDAGAPDMLPPWGVRFILAPPVAPGRGT